MKVILSHPSSKLTICQITPQNIINEIRLDFHQLEAILLGVTSLIYKYIKYNVQKK